MTNTAFPLAGISLEHETALPVSSRSAPQSARVFNVDGFSWVFVELPGDFSGRAVLVTENDVFLRDMGVHS